jgi:hypothetical protein
VGRREDIGYVLELAVYICSEAETEEKPSIQEL